MRLPSVQRCNRGDLFGGGGIRGVIFTIEVSLAILILLTVKTSSVPEARWDFLSYYNAALGQAFGENPYDLELVNRISERVAYFTYAYHPITLWYFRAFAWLPYEQASLAYIVVQWVFWCAAICIALMVLEAPVRAIPFVLTNYFGLCGALFIALSSGNTAILEALLIWSGLWGAIRARFVLSCICFCTAGFFKGTPLILCALPFYLAGDTRERKKVAATVLAAVIIWYGYLMLHPDLSVAYLGYVSGVRETGNFNPCSFALISDLVGHPDGQSPLVYVLFSFWVVVVTRVTWSSISKLRWSENRPQIIAILMLSYALVCPRFKDYAYIQLLPIFYVLLGESWLILVTVLSSVLITDVQRLLPKVVVEYQQLICLLIAWQYLIARSSIGNLHEPLLGASTS